MRSDDMDWYNIRDQYHLQGDRTPKRREYSPSFYKFREVFRIKNYETFLELKRKNTLNKLIYQINKLTKNEGFEPI